MSRGSSPGTLSFKYLSAFFQNEFVSTILSIRTLAGRGKTSLPLAFSNARALTTRRNLDIWLRGSFFFIQGIPAAGANDNKGPAYRRPA